MLCCCSIVYYLRARCCSAVSPLYCDNHLPCVIAGCVILVLSLSCRISDSFGYHPSRRILTMSRLAVHKLSTLSLPVTRGALPCYSLSLHSRSTLPLPSLTSRCLSTSVSLAPLRSRTLLHRSLGVNIRLVDTASHPLSQSLSASANSTVAVIATQQRRHQSSSSSSHSSSSSSFSIPRSLVFIAPAALVAFLLSELDLTPTADCATLPSISVSTTSSPSLSLSPSPRLIAPLAGDDYVVASWWRRILAFLIDNSLVSIAFSLADKYIAPLTGPYGTVAVPLMSFLFNFTYETVCYVYCDGQTLGKWVLGIRVVRDDGGVMDVKTSALVFGGKVLNILLMADVIYGLLNLDRDGKCIHNVVSGTTVVRRVPAETFIQTVQV